MNKKLTLTIEKEVVEKAKKYASEKGKSLSGLVENYLKVLVDDSQNRTPGEHLSPRIKKLKGILKVDDDFDYKQILEEEITRKFDE